MPHLYSEIRSFAKLALELIIFTSEPEAKGLKNLEGLVPETGLATTSAAAADIDDNSTIKSNCARIKKLKKSIYPKRSLKSLNDR